MSLTPLVNRRFTVAFVLLTAITAAAVDAAESHPAALDMLTLPVRVVDAEGQPVAGATVVPWALRCSQGHGLWRPTGFGGNAPPTLSTSADGRADVPYPRYTDPDEWVRTTEVTLSIDHPEFAYVSYEFVTCRTSTTRLTK
jgi:hypothetical protein